MRQHSKKNTAPVASEDQEHVAILLYLEWALPKRATPAWHTPNGGKRDKSTAGKMKKLGTRAGFPDIAFLCDGNLYTFEVKSATGTQRQTQKDWQEAITSAGGFYAIVRNVDQAKQQLREWGLIPQSIRR